MIQTSELVVQDNAADDSADCEEDEHCRDNDWRKIALHRHV